MSKHARLAITVEFDVPAAMRDGTMLRANIYRPAARGRWPVLLTRLPYGKDGPLGTTIPDPVQVAGRGYVVIVQDTRGCGKSDGEWYPMLFEAEDGVDTIAWAAALPYADGQVGMFGGSYFGFTQWAAAVRRPPALKAIAPLVTWADPLRELLYRDGAFELGLQAHWNLGMGPGQLFRRLGNDPPRLGAALAAWVDEADALGSTGYPSLPLAEFAPLRRQAVAPAFFAGITAPMDRELAIVGAMTIFDKQRHAEVPSLNVGGWYDILLSGTIANYQAMRAQGVPARLLIGPWTHVVQNDPIGERTFGFASQAAMVDLKASLVDLQMRWFDHWLKGTDPDLMAEAPIKLFVMGANVWRDEQEWPPARAKVTPWYLHSGGTLSLDGPDDEEPDCYTYDPADPVPTRGGATLMSQQYPAGPYDQCAIEARSDVLVYTSVSLPHDTEVTGPIIVQLWATSSASDTDFVARLTDVFPDGRSMNLTDGIVRARYRSFRAGEAPSPIESGRPYLYTIDLWATSNVFLAGHRIRLQITSSNFPRWDRNPNTGHPFGADAVLQTAWQQILHDGEHPSHVQLPLVAPAG